MSKIRLKLFQKLILQISGKSTTLHLTENRPKKEPGNVQPWLSTYKLCNVCNYVPTNRRWAGEQMQRKCPFFTWVPQLFFQIALLNCDKAFTYDFAFDSFTPQNAVFDKAVDPLIGNLFKGKLLQRNFTQTNDFYTFWFVWAIELIWNFGELTHFI